MRVTDHPLGTAGSAGAVGAFALCWRSSPVVVGTSAARLTDGAICADCSNPCNSGALSFRGDLRESAPIAEAVLSVHWHPFGCQYPRFRVSGNPSDRADGCGGALRRVARAMRRASARRPPYPFGGSAVLRVRARERVGARARIGASERGRDSTRPSDARPSTTQADRTSRATGFAISRDIPRRFGELSLSC